MNEFRVPGSGEYLLSHLAAYGLAFLLDRAGVDAFLRHDEPSQSFEPIVEFDLDEAGVVELIRRSAAVTERIIEADIDPGTTGFDRKPAIWARASFQNDPGRASRAASVRQGLADAAQDASDHISLGLLAGLGSPAVWGPRTMKPSHGATRLDGVLGNHTSDFVRGVLRHFRSRAAELESLAEMSDFGDTPDKTGWSPPGTTASAGLQWLAAMGIALFPVVHRAAVRSQTPSAGRVDGADVVILPVLDAGTTVARLRTLLLIGRVDDDGSRAVLRRQSLRILGVSERVVFATTWQEGAGSSTAFTFARGRIERTS